MTPDITFSFGTSQNKDIFSSGLNVSRFLDLIKSSYVAKNLETLRLQLEEFKKKIDNSKTKEMEINKFLVDKPWLISFDYASLESKKQGKFDIYISNKTWANTHDVIELKRADKKVKTKYSTHETISAELGKAISQCINYMENKEDQIEHGIIIIGRGSPESMGKLDRYLHNIEVLTYDKIYEKAKRVLDFLQKKYIDKVELKDEDKE